MKAQLILVKIHQLARMTLKAGPLSSAQYIMTIGCF
jgi:hypothetical protein